MIPKLPGAGRSVLSSLLSHQTTVFWDQRRTFAPAERRNPFRLRASVTSTVTSTDASNVVFDTYENTPASEGGQVCLGGRLGKERRDALEYGSTETADVQNVVAIRSLSRGVRLAAAERGRSV